MWAATSIAIIVVAVVGIITGHLVTEDITKEELS